ncbi:MAG: hypothetical protein AB4040_18355 [Synechococcus sp.]
MTCRSTAKGISPIEAILLVMTDDAFPHAGSGSLQSTARLDGRHSKQTG